MYNFVVFCDSWWRNQNKQKETLQWQTGYYRYAVWLGGWAVVVSFNFRQNVWFPSCVDWILPYSIALAIGLYNNLYYCTSHDNVVYGCCRSDTAVDSQPVAVSASTDVAQTLSEAEVKREPISPPPQPTTTHEMFGVRNPVLLHGHYGSAEVADGGSNRFQTVVADGRFPSLHSSHAVSHRFQTSPECSTPTAEVSYRPLVGAHQPAPTRHFHPNEPVAQTTVDLFSPNITRFHSGVNRFNLGMEPFRGRLPDPAAANIANIDRFQFLHPPRYLANGGDRFHPIPAHIGDDCIAGRFQLAAVSDSVLGGAGAVASTNGPLDSMYQCHRDFDSSLYTAAKRPRLAADDWLCWVHIQCCLCVVVCSHSLVFCLISFTYCQWVVSYCLRFEARFRWFSWFRVCYQFYVVNPVCSCCCK